LRSILYISSKDVHKALGHDTKAADEETLALSVEVMERVRQ